MGKKRKKTEQPPEAKSSDSNTYPTARPAAKGKRREENSIATQAITRQNKVPQAKQQGR